MRDLTEQEQKQLTETRRCIFCGCNKFRKGPSGGINTNIYCGNVDCEAGYNINPLGMTFELIADPKPIYPGANIPFKEGQ